MTEVTPAGLRREAEIARNEARLMGTYEAYAVRYLADRLDAAAAALAAAQQPRNLLQMALKEIATNG